MKLKVLSAELIKPNVVMVFYKSNKRKINKLYLTFQTFKDMKGSLCIDNCLLNKRCKEYIKKYHFHTICRDLYSNEIIKDILDMDNSPYVSVIISKNYEA